MEMMPEGAKTIDGKAELIQMLIPLGLKAVGDLLREEVEVLAGSRYRHEGGPTRGASRPGRCILGMRNSGSKYRGCGTLEATQSLGLRVTPGFNSRVHWTKA